MSTHTPGPWHVEARKGDTCICRADGAILARLGASTNWRGNARLIAAAPDLLAALERIANETAATWVSDVARAAIAKAEGKE